MPREQQIKAPKSSLRLRLCSKVPHRTGRTGCLGIQIGRASMCRVLLFGAARSDVEQESRDIKSLVMYLPLVQGFQSNEKQISVFTDF